MKPTIEPAQDRVVEGLTPRAVDCYVTIAPSAKRRFNFATEPFSLALGKPCNQIGRLPAILDAAKASGARSAGYVVLRLPHAVKDVFSAWLDEHFPSKKERVFARVRELRGGKLNVAEWGRRMSGEGIFAEQIHDLFAVAVRRAGLNKTSDDTTTENFRRPGGVQMSLF